MNINTRILLGFFMITVLIIVLSLINTTLNNNRLDKTKQIKDVESPLELMVEHVNTYDAMLTEAAYVSLLHAKKGDMKSIREHKKYYDETAVKFDNLLKFQARMILEKSERPQEIKDKIHVYLKRLDEVNTALVDLEIRAFEAMEKNDTETAYSLIVGEQYHMYKYELAKIYSDWSAIEQGTTSQLRQKIIDESEQLNKINLYFSLAIILMGVVTSFFIARSISKPIKDLKEEVDGLSKGKLDIRLRKTSITDIQNLIDSLDRILATMKLAILKTGLAKSEFGFLGAINSKKETEEKYRVLYESSKDAIMIVEPPNWNFTSGNHATLKLFNVKDEKKLISLNPGDLSPKYQLDGQLSAKKSMKMIEKAVKEGSNFFEWTHKKYNGKEFPATVLLSRIKGKEKTYLQATVRDITLEKVLIEKYAKRREGTVSKREETETRREKTRATANKQK